MLDILFEIYKRSQYPISEQQLYFGKKLRLIDTCYKQIKHESNNRYSYLIIPEKSFRDSISVSPEIINDLYISYIISLGNIFAPNVNINFSLYVLQKEKPQTINIAIFKEDIGAILKDEETKYDYMQLVVPNDYSDVWYTYIDDIEKWINSGEKPEQSFYAEFNMIDFVDVKSDPFASHYTKLAIEYKELLKSKELVPLCEMAEIIRPLGLENDESLSKIFDSSKKMQYPLDNSYYIKATGLMPVLQKGDILVYMADELNITIIADELKETVFSPILTTIIRPHFNISPEYIFLFLQSSIVKTLVWSQYDSLYEIHISEEELGNIGLIKPQRAATEYRRIFEKSYHKDYEMTVFAERFISNDSETYFEDMFYKSLIDNLKLKHDQQVRKIINNDICELQRCFNAKAYKATLILAGSILEAFLTDWLCELDNKDYFADDLKIRIEGKNVKASLANMIKRIAVLKHPDWMVSKEKADTIRSYRNKVHAKLCLNRDTEINEELCRKVIIDLKEIINTRYNLKSIKRVNNNIK